MWALVRPPQYAPAPCNWLLEQSPRVLMLEVTEHVGDAGHLHSIQVSRRPSRYEDIGDFRSLVKRPSDLDL